jgi:hypothetical protein
LSTNARSAERLALFPGETISMIDTTWPSEWWMATRFARAAKISLSARRTCRVFGGVAVITPPPRGSGG